jgi:hypothetical protein
VVTTVGDRVHRRVAGRTPDRQPYVGRGREVTTTGDGFVAMFDGAERAIRAAQSMRGDRGSPGR